MARLGELLVDDQRITTEQLQDALDHQRANGGRLGSALMVLGLSRDEDISMALGRQQGVPSMSLAEFTVAAEVIALVPVEMATRHQVLPVCRSPRTLTLAMTTPNDIAAIDDVRFLTGLHVEPVVVSEAAMRLALARYYSTGAVTMPAADPVTRALEDLGSSGRDDVEVLTDGPAGDTTTLDDGEGDAPVIRLVNAVLLSAIRRGASDVHIEPYERELRIRFRIDGVLQSVSAPALRFRDPLTSRIKIMAQLDIAERRLPQDGRIKVRFRDGEDTREIDFRVSCLPTLFGETIVLRLLDRQQLRLDMTQLGFEPAALARCEAAIRQPWGLVLVTGPTGSGKTNTLYSAITRLNRPGINILTVEDPVEFNLAGINQVQVRESIGLSFATALRAFLRQDPNVMLVGEIRDSETAAIAVKAALTGHLVLSTLHTNDAPSSVSRLVNMGIERFLVASAINLVCAQRLVRRLCTHCRERDVRSTAAFLDAGFGEEDIATLAAWRPRGCPFCAGTGFHGRVGLFEVMASTEALRALVLDGAPVDVLRRQAIADGMVTLRRAGLAHVRAGLTSLDDVLRETVSW
jgi:type IV pilus assembly protein PilB